MPSKSRYAPWVVVGAVVLLVASGLVYVLYGRPVSEVAPAEEAPVATQEPAAQEAADAGTSESPRPGIYTAYSQQALEQTAPAVRRLLFFHASWCPQCRALEKDIEASGVPNDTAIFKVDYDNSASLKQKYGVTLQTTIVEIDPSGSLVRKHVAYNQPTLEAVLKALGG